MPHQIGLWCIFLINDVREMAQFAVNSATPYAETGAPIPETFLFNSTIFTKCLTMLLIVCVRNMRTPPQSKATGTMSSKTFKGPASTNFSDGNELVGCAHHGVRKTPPANKASPNRRNSFASSLSLLATILGCHNTGLFSVENCAYCQPRNTED